jgi:tRNA modification GTPase
MLVVANKSDLPARTSLNAIQQVIMAEDAAAAPLEIIVTSALTGQGIEELRGGILRAAGAGNATGSEGELVTNVRHLQLLRESLEALGRCRQAAEERIHHEMLLLDLYEGLRPLDALTGATDVEDILGIIFSRFCIGK